MLNAARVHGRPMMVIAMITAATSHPKAIQTPPKIIHSTFRSSDRADIIKPSVRRLLPAEGSYRGSLDRSSRVVFSASPALAPIERGENLSKECADAARHYSSRSKPDRLRCAQTHGEETI